MKNRNLVSIIFATLLVFALQSTSFAYVITPYKLNGGIENRKFTVPSNANYTYNGTTVNYGPEIRSMVTEWNNLVDDLGWGSGNRENIHYTETTSYPDSQLDFYVYEYGNTEWRGVVDYYNSAGTQLGTPGYMPPSNWDWNKAKLNVSYIHEDAAVYRKSTIGHEMGHALGLAHSDSNSSIMKEGYIYRSPVPAYDDSDGIRALY